MLFVSRFCQNSSSPHTFGSLVSYKRSCCFLPYVSSRHPFYVWPRVNVLGCSSLWGREQKCPAAPHRCVATHRPLFQSSTEGPTASRRRLKKNQSKNLTGRAIVSASPRRFPVSDETQTLDFQLIWNKVAHEPTLRSPRISVVFAQYRSQLETQPSHTSADKPALLDGAAKRNYRVTSTRAAQFPKSHLTGSAHVRSTVCPWCPCSRWSRALTVPTVSISASTSMLAPELPPPPAPSFGSDLITLLFALSYSELLWNDYLLRTEVFLPPCQHSMESLPLTPAAPPARSLSKRFFPFGLCSAFVRCGILPVYFVLTHACFSFPPLHLPFHPIIYRVRIVSVFRNGL